MERDQQATTSVDGCAETRAVRCRHCEDMIALGQAYFLDNLPYCVGCWSYLESMEDT